MSRADKERRKAADLDQENFYGHLTKLRNSLDHESDRGCVVVAAAFLDEALEALLRARLVDDGRLEELFEHPHPLSTFSAKTRMAFAVGSISRGERDDADIIRALRNEFAHLHPVTAFADKHVKDACGRLRILGALDRAMIEEDPRWSFTLAVSLLASDWWTRLLPSNTERLELAEDKTWTEEQIRLFAEDPPVSERA
jgi:DNA-binding MltR family transcriptional regulator